MNFFQKGILFRWEPPLRWALDPSPVCHPLNPILYNFIKK